MGMKWVGVALALGLLVAACTAESGSSTEGSVTAGAGATGSPASSTRSPASATSQAGDASVTTGSTASSPCGDCPAFEGMAFEVTGESDMVDISSDGLGIRATVYARPDYEGNPWSHWGQGIVTADGRYLSAIGDHLGAEGNSYFFEYDPATGILSRIGDVRSIIDPSPSDWGHGKVHAQMVAGPCGEIYAASYWGSRRGIDQVDYEGGALMRIDPVGRTFADLGAPVPGYGIPSLASWPEGGLLYGEGADPNAPRGQNSGPFFVYDTATGEVVFSEAEGHQGFRSIAVDASGRAFVGFGEGSLSVYDPASNTLEPFAGMPGSRLRAATTVAPDGTIYAASEGPDVFFALGADGSVEQLGAARAYTTSLAMEPDGSVVYSVPGAHGDGYELGTPLVALDTATGSQTELVKLAPLVEDALGLRIGGTYAISLDAEARRLFITFNAGGPQDRDPFGEVVLVEVTLP